MWASQSTLAGNVKGIATKSQGSATLALFGVKVSAIWMFYSEKRSVCVCSHPVAAISASFIHSAGAQASHLTFRGHNWFLKISHGAAAFYSRSASLEQVIWWDVCEPKCADAHKGVAAILKASQSKEKEASERSTRLLFVCFFTQPVW